MSLTKAIMQAINHSKKNGLTQDELFARCTNFRNQEVFKVLVELELQGKVVQISDVFYDVRFVPQTVQIEKKVSFDLKNWCVKKLLEHKNTWGAFKKIGDIYQKRTNSNGGYVQQVIALSRHNKWNPTWNALNDLADSIKEYESKTKNRL
jgi:hypothetical protein